MKVMFLSWHFNTPRIFLDYIRHLTPNRSGVWKDMIATTNKEEADFFLVFDGHNDQIDESRAIYFCQHPKVEGYSKNMSPSFKSYKDKQCLRAFNSENALNAGEWWLDYDYDFLSSLKQPKKQHQLACIMTYQPQTNDMYAQRILWLKSLSRYNKAKSLSLDVFGRPEEKYKADEDIKEFFRGSLGSNNPDGSKGEHTHGKNILIDYKYSIEVDVGPTKNYISERFYDAMLLWCKPIYFGSVNVHDYLPKDSFDYIDILDLTSIYKIDTIVNSEIDYNAMAEARDLLLNKYQVWANAYDVIKSL